MFDLFSSVWIRIFLRSQQFFSGWPISSCSHIEDVWWKSFSTSIVSTHCSRLSFSSILIGRQSMSTRNRGRFTDNDHISLPNISRSSMGTHSLCWAISLEEIHVFTAFIQSPHRMGISLDDDRELHERSKDIQFQPSEKPWCSSIICSLWKLSPIFSFAMSYSNKKPFLRNIRNVSFGQSWLAFSWSFSGIKDATGSTIKPVVSNRKLLRRCRTRAKKKIC